MQRIQSLLLYYYFNFRRKHFQHKFAKPQEDDVFLLFISLCVYSFLRWFFSYFYDSFFYLNIVYCIVGMWVVYQTARDNSSVICYYINKYLSKALYKLIGLLLKDNADVSIYEYNYEKNHKNNFIDLLKDWENSYDYGLNISSEMGPYFSWLETKSEEIIENANNLDFQLTSYANRNRLSTGFHHLRLKTKLSNSLHKIFSSKKYESSNYSITKEEYIPWHDYKRLSAEELSLKLFNKSNKSALKLTRKILSANRNGREPNLVTVYSFLAIIQPKHLKVEQKVSLLKAAPLVYQNFNDTGFNVNFLEKSFIDFYQKLFSNTSYENYSYIFYNLSMFDLIKNFQKSLFLLKTDSFDPPSFKSMKEIDNYLVTLQEMNYCSNKTINYHDNFKDFQFLDGLSTNDYSIKILRAEDEFKDWGAKLSHCIGKDSHYFSRVNRGDALVLGVSYKGNKHYNVLLSNTMSNEIKGIRNRDYKNEWNNLITTLCNSNPDIKKYQYMLLT